MDQKDNCGMALVMNNVPLHVFYNFTKDIKSRYNNCYWVKLLDLLRKAEMYDAMMANQHLEEHQLPEELETVEQKEESGIKTFGGVLK